MLHNRHFPRGCFCLLVEFFYSRRHIIRDYFFPAGQTEKAGNIANYDPMVIFLYGYTCSRFSLNHPQNNSYTYLPTPFPLSLTVSTIDRTQTFFIHRNFRLFQVFCRTRDNILSEYKSSRSLLLRSIPDKRELIRGKPFCRNNVYFSIFLSAVRIWLIYSVWISSSPA